MQKVKFNSVTQLSTKTEKIFNCDFLICGEIEKVYVKTIDGRVHSIIFQRPTFFWYKSNVQISNFRKQIKEYFNKNYK